MFSEPERPIGNACNLNFVYIGKGHVEMKLFFFFALDLITHIRFIHIF